MDNNIEQIQILNSAIIQAKEKKLNDSYGERLRRICDSPAVVAINKSISYLAEANKVPRDQAALQIIETIFELQDVWDDYVKMEGILKLKKIIEKKR